MMAWIINHRFVVIFLALCLIGFMGSGTLFLQKTSDYRMYFDDDDPLLQKLEALEDTYIKEDNVLIVIAPENGEIFTQNVLAMVKEVTEAAWNIPYSIRVDSVTNFQYSHADDDETIIVEDLVENPGVLSEAQLRALREIALNEPLLRNKLISPSAHVTGIKVTIQLPDANSDQERPQVVTYVRQLAEQMRGTYPKIKLYLTGNVFMNNAFPEASQKDMETLIPAMFGLIILLLIVLLKKGPAIVTTIIVFLFSIVATMGLAGWLGIKLSPAAASAPLIILTLAVADSVHLLISYHYLLARDNLERRAAIMEAIRINRQPIFLTSFTTVIGFLSMNFSDSPPFRDLGNMTAIGVAIAFVLSVTLLPALMMTFPERKPKIKASNQTWIYALADVVIRYRHRFLWGMAALIVVLMVFIPLNKLDEQFIKYFDESMEFRQATDFASENLTGIEYIDYSLSAGESDGINKPQFLQQVETFANWYRQQPEVLHVTAITDTIKQLNKNMHGDDQAWYHLPKEQELTAQYLLFYEMSLPYGLDLNDRINVDKSATRLTVTLRDISTEKQLALEERAQAWLQHNASTIQSDGLGRTILFAHIAKNNIMSMLNGTFLAMLLISGIIIIAFRSWKIGILSLFCNIFPAAMTFGVWGIVSGRIGMAASVIVAVTLGIVVDDTIHFLSKYLRARKEQQLTPEEAVRYTFSNVGMAMSITSLILLAGFLLLSLSTFQVNATLGLLVAITIVLALVLDFLFLPPLLMKFEEKQA